jgi:PRC-barrel domain
MNRIVILAASMALAANTITAPVVAQTAPPALSFVTAQPANESLARVFLGANVNNPTGEVVGDIRDLVFDRSGHISTVVLGVGGFLGMGEKNVAVPFSALTMSNRPDGTRMISIAASRDCNQGRRAEG